MLAVKATFDGERIVIPEECMASAGRVIVILESASDADDASIWLKALETEFAKAWDNPEDEIYDRM